MFTVEELTNLSRMEAYDAIRKIESMLVDAKKCTCSTDRNCKQDFHIDATIFDNVKTSAK